jgi:hypothetical protein
MKRELPTTAASKVATFGVEPNSIYGLFYPGPIILADPPINLRLSHVPPQKKPGPISWDRVYSFGVIGTGLASSSDLFRRVNYRDSDKLTPHWSA